MKLYIVRHGDASHLNEGIVGGWTESILSKEGEGQAEQLAKDLDGAQIDYIFSSDILRTRQTAEIIAKRIGAPIVFDWLIRERNNGLLQGKSSAGIDWGMLNQDGPEARKLNIEPLTNMDRRAEKFLDSLSVFPANLHNVLVVSHNGFINNLLGVLSSDHEFRKISHTEIIERDFDVK